LELGEYGGGERGGYGQEAGPLEGEREGPEAVEGRTPGGSWKKAGGKPGRREGEAEEKREEGGLRDWGLRRGCGSACKTKNNGPSS